MDHIPLGGLGHAFQAARVGQIVRHGYAAVQAVNEVQQAAGGVVGAAQALHAWGTRRAPLRDRDETGRATSLTQPPITPARGTGANDFTTPTAIVPYSAPGITPYGPPFIAAGRYQRMRARLLVKRRGRSFVKTNKGKNSRRKGFKRNTRKNA